MSHYSTRRKNKFKREQEIRAEARVEVAKEINQQISSDRLEDNAWCAMVENIEEICDKIINQNKDETNK